MSVFYPKDIADNEKVTIDADAKEYNKTTRTDYAEEKTLHFAAAEGKPLEGLLVEKEKSTCLEAYVCYGNVESSCWY